MRDILYMLMTSVLASNVIFVRFEGLCSFLGSSGKRSTASFISLSTGFVLIASAAINWVLYHLVLQPLNLLYLETVLYLFVIACLVQLCENFAGKLSKSLSRDLGIYPVLILTNSAVLSLTLENVSRNLSFGMSVFSAFCVALGYFLATFLFGAVCSRLQSEEIPASFRGLPAILIAASIVSLAFFGFEGVVDGIFGM